MYCKLASVVILLTIARNGYARPKDPDPLESSSSQEVTQESLEAINRTGTYDSRHDQNRGLKDIQNMDQSLRTVATQLLNVTTKHEDIIRIPEEKIVTIETPTQVVHISTRVEDALDKSNNDKEDNFTKMKFGIPINSKFGHFTMNNPGQAMAMTEEEIIKEMASLSTSAQKYNPTTTSLLSTWIQLYPPSTTTEGKNISNSKIDTHNNQIYSLSDTKLPSNILEISTINPMKKVEMKLTTKPYIESLLSTKKFIKNSSIHDVLNYSKISTTMSTFFVQNNTNETDLIENTFKNQQNQRINPSVRPIIKSTIITKKLSSKISTTSKPKLTTLKNPLTRLIKNNSTINKVKFLPNVKSNKNDSMFNTSKIEKVILKPITTASQIYSSNTEKPLFITKIKTSILTDIQKTTTAIPTINPIHNIPSKSNLTNINSANVIVSSTTHINKDLKIHLKKPVDDSTKIEIEPIQVNPPVLTIEKIEDSSFYPKTDNDQDILKNSKIDVKFEFNPEYTNVKLQSPSIDTSSKLMYTTTKRPRLSNKRKKNKNRRRKPSSTIPSTLTTSLNLSAINNSLSTFDSINIGQNNEHHKKLQSTTIQESKIEPESKVLPPKKKKSNQTQIQKPIGTQIYNFLSREVMPSVGVMSLVGLGLGLASYFLYPFGGVIARRNYDVEPNYKYNLDEYGGNYGLSEEEVLSKVYSGMTDGQNYENKYNAVTTSEKNPTFYRYTGEERWNQQSSRNPIHSIKNYGNRVIYRPIETTSYDVNYRKEFKYPDVSTTPNYYERQRQQHLSTVSNVGIGKNRQFVVGNIPKEYSSREINKSLDLIKVQNEENHNFHYETIQKYSTENSSTLPLIDSTLKSSNNLVSSVSRIDTEQSPDVYEEIEITPTAVAIEHGPRLLKSFVDLKNERKDSKLIRRKRSVLTEITATHVPLLTSNFKNSVIQVIPSKIEIEEDKKHTEQEDISNEIFDIIDDVLPIKLNKKKQNLEEKNNSMINTKIKKEHMNTSIKFISVLSKNKKSNNNSIIENNSKKSSVITDNIKSNTENQLKDIAATSAKIKFTTMTSLQESMVTNSVVLNETISWKNNITMSDIPNKTQLNGTDIISIAKRIVEIKLRLGLTILKHASERLARYIENIQKTFNGNK